MAAANNRHDRRCRSRFARFLSLIPKRASIPPHIRSAAVVASTALLFSCGQDSQEDSTVRVVSWGGQFQADLIESWVQPASKAANVSLQTETWDGDYGALTTRIEKHLNTWDLIHVELFFVKNPRSRNLFEAFPNRSLETLGDAIRNDESTSSLVASGYAVPVLEYAYVLAGRRGNNGAYDPATLNWAQFWDIKKIPGRRGLRDFPVGNIEVSLASLGHNSRSYLYSETDPAEIRKKVTEALERLTEISPVVVWWKTGDALQQGLESGDMILAGAWSGRVLAAFRTACPRVTEVTQCVIAANPSTAFISTDWWVIPKGAPHAKGADRLISSMFSPALTAGAIDFSKKQGYAVPINTGIDSDTVSSHYLTLGSSANSEAAGRIDEEFWSTNFDMINDMWLRWRAKGKSH